MLLRTAAGVTLAAGAASASARARRSSSSASAEIERQLADPAARARLRTKVVGSIAEETIYTFCRMHIYLWLNDGNLQPLFTMQNPSAAKWQPLPNGHFRNRQFEAGVYTRFDSDEILDSWQNPVTDAIYQRPMAQRDRQPQLFLGLALLLRGASRWSAR